MSYYRSRKRHTFITGLLFSAPWIIGFLLFVLYPLLSSFYYSFTDFNIFQPPKWVGLKNFRILLQDDQFYISLYNTFFMTFVGTPAYLIFGLFVAILLNQKIRGLSIFRTIFYVPFIIPIVATVLLWIWVLNPQNGLLNNVLKPLGMGQPNWLGDPDLTKFSLILMGLWRTGPIIIIFLAGLQDIPRTLFEAAGLDGAGPIRRFWHITLPTLTPVILFQVIWQMILMLQFFTEAYVITGASGGLNAASGGPENSLLFFPLYLFHNAFVYLKMGKASAMALILFLLTAVLTWIIFRSSRRWVNYGDR